ncbi:6399_t:CDS:1, partial [Scutellospora calospora]
ALLDQDEDIEIYTYDVNTFIVIGHPPIPYNERHKSKCHYHRTIYKRRHPVIYSKRQYGSSENSTSFASISKNKNWYSSLLIISVLIIRSYL